MLRRFTYLLLVALCFGCSSGGALDGKSYMKWVKNPENGLILRKEINGLVFSAQYKPYDFIILNEEKTYELPTKLVEDRTKELEGMAYYNIRITTDDNKDILAKGATNKEYYMQRLNYLSYDFQNDIKLFTETDSIHCSLYHFVQGHGVVPYVDMVVGFPIKEKIMNQTLVINDQVFGNGIIKFYIDKKDINNIPQLITI